MEADEQKQQYINQIREFLAFTPDTDNDTISAQYTLIRGLANEYGERVRSQNQEEPHVFDLVMADDTNDDYDYFLELSTMRPQPVQRKQFALAGLQERCRRILSVLETGN